MLKLIFGIYFILLIVHFIYLFFVVLNNYREKRKIGKVIIKWDKLRSGYFTSFLWLTIIYGSTSFVFWFIYFLVS